MFKYIVIPVIVIVLWALAIVSLPDALALKLFIYSKLILEGMILGGICGFVIWAWRKIKGRKG
jgi:hypothetical protein